ncbi:MAG: hypothetical protein ACI3WQ_03770 [Faecousia sp.]
MGNTISRLSKNDVIPSQCSHWRGNLPDLQTFSMQNMQFFCSFRGLPHQPAGWFAMTSLFWDFFDTLKMVNTILSCAFLAGRQRRREMYGLRFLAAMPLTA